MMLIQHSVNSDWLFNTQSRGLQAYRCISEINEQATLNIKHALLDAMSLILIKFQYETIATTLV